MVIPTSQSNVEYLSSLRAVREGCFKVQEAAVKNKLQHFDIDTTKLQDMVQLVLSLIKRDFDEPSQIPTHGCWRYFDAGRCSRIQTLISSWASLGTDPIEQTRRVLDLFVITIILDVDPQVTFSYREPTSNRTFKRREAIAIAVLDMFMAGTFSMNTDQPHQVDCKLKYNSFGIYIKLNLKFCAFIADALMRLTLEDLLDGFKTTSKTLIGLESRLALLKHLVQLLQQRPDYFGGEEGHVPRPGNMIGSYQYI